MTPAGTPPRSRACALRPLFTADQIRTRVNAMADTLAADLPDGELLCVALLNGSFIFAADLARALADRDVHPVIDFMTPASYGGGTASSGSVTLKHDLSLPVKGRDILLVDDILDTGLTLQAVCRLLAERGAASVHTCVLLDKPSRRRVPVTADLVGFVIDDVFVVGYGLDYDHRYRHLPYLAALTLDAAEPAPAALPDRS